MKMTHPHYSHVVLLMTKLCCYYVYLCGLLVILTSGKHLLSTQQLLNIVSEVTYTLWSVSLSWRHAPPKSSLTPMLFWVWLCCPGLSGVLFLKLPYLLYFTVYAHKAHMYFFSTSLWCSKSPQFSQINWQETALFKGSVSVFFSPTHSAVSANGDIAYFLARWSTSPIVQSIRQQTSNPKVKNSNPASASSSNSSIQIHVSLTQHIF